MRDEIKESAVEIPEKYHEAVLDLIKWPKRDFPKISLPNADPLDDRYYAKKLKSEILLLQETRDWKPVSLIECWLGMGSSKEKNRKFYLEIIKNISDLGLKYILVRSSGGGLSIITSLRQDFLDFWKWCVENISPASKDKEYLHGLMLGYPLNKIFMGKQGLPECIKNILIKHNIDMPEGRVIENNFVNRRTFTVVENIDDPNYPKDKDFKVYASNVKLKKIAAYLEKKYNI
jgi:hypothetical protein